MVPVLERRRLRAFRLLPFQCPAEGKWPLVDEGSHLVAVRHEWLLSPVGSDIQFSLEGEWGRQRVSQFLQPGGGYPACLGLRLGLWGVPPLEQMVDLGN